MLITIRIRVQQQQQHARPKNLPNLLNGQWNCIGGEAAKALSLCNRQQRILRQGGIIWRPVFLPEITRKGIINIAHNFE